MSENWEEWLRLYGPALLLFARQWARDGQDAEDLLQEAFLRFWKSRQQAQDPKAYLFSCVRNCALELHRAERRLKERERITEKSAHGFAEPAFVQRPEQDEQRQALEAALKELPDEQREVVVMKIWGGLTFPQIAEVAGTPADTAASRYRYAMQSLRRALAKEALQ
ncbi:MAG TPA: RNA polymerase sigma factor [Planctomycetota bacterium]|nr:RNA polymerase sigma factor [Planctomycetota bacterium]